MQTVNTPNAERWPYLCGRTIGALLRFRETWKAGAIAALAMLPLVPLWFDYVTVIRGTDLGLGYSLLNLPLVLLPLATWRSRTPGSSRT